MNSILRTGIRTAAAFGRRNHWWLSLWICWGAMQMIAQAAGGAFTSGRVLKVLPHLQDQDGRIALAPSLYQRDAYQALLRQHPEMVSTIQYDIHCKVSGRTADTLKVRLSLRTSLRGESDPLILEAPIKRGIFGRCWQSLKVDPSVYRASGNVIAWRAELLAGNTVIGSQDSFFW